MAQSTGNQVQRPAAVPDPKKQDSEAPLSVALPKQRTTEPPPNRAQERDTIPAPTWFVEETD